ncbi:glycosyltransferase family 9 protein, partial [Candidatus Latescibacterota bacterium]
RLKPIGDTVLISPVFRNLKRMYPQAKIDVVVYPFVFDLIKNNPYVDNVIVVKRDFFGRFFFYIQSLFKSYDVIIDYINNPTSAAISFLTRAKVRIGNKTKRNFFYTFKLQDREITYSSIRCLKKLQPLGLDDFDDYYPKLYLDDKDEKAADMFLKESNIDGDIVGIFVSAKYPTRQYPAECFAELGMRIVRETSFNVLFIFGLHDEQTLRCIKVITGKEEKIYFRQPDTTLGELAALLSKLTYLITNDTGPKHVATALQIPTLTVFGPTEERMWNPPDLKTFPVVRKKLVCTPCNKIPCRFDTIECMKTLKPEEVFSAFLKMVDERQ